MVDSVYLLEIKMTIDDIGKVSPFEKPIQTNIVERFNLVNETLSKITDVLEIHDEHLKLININLGLLGDKLKELENKNG